MRKSGFMLRPRFALLTRAWVRVLVGILNSAPLMEVIGKLDRGGPHKAAVVGSLRSLGDGG